MKRLCTICARGGSKGVKGKNLRSLLGHPLLSYTIQQAQKSGLFEAIAVSSDSNEILEVAKNYGIEILVTRPPELATDTAGKVPAIQHCALDAENMSQTRFDTVVDLDATSPLRLIADIRGAVTLLETSSAASVITGAPARRSPYFNLVELQPDGTIRLAKPPTEGISRRQDVPRCYDLNASIYVWSRDTLIKTGGVFHSDTRLFEMPEERSLDIDSELDFELVEYIAKSRKRFQDVW